MTPAKDTNAQCRNEAGSSTMLLLFYVVAVLLPLLAVVPLITSMLSALNATR